MANFFRRVRQQLFIKNRFAKYLVYAAGEILLVALQVNNLELVKAETEF